MVTFLYQGRYTAEGVRGVLGEGGQSRFEATRALFESLGGRIIYYGFTFGPHDFVILAELPDESVASRPALIARSTGTVDVTAVRVYGPEEIQLAAGGSVPHFRAAGKT